MHHVPAKASSLPFFHPDGTAPGGTAIRVTDKKDLAGEAIRIEEAMARVATPAEGSPGRLRVAVVGSLPADRSVFSGGDAVGDGTLAEALASLLGRPFDTRDVVFLVEENRLGFMPREGETLHVAIHNIARLVAAGTSERNRDGLYACACAAILASIEMDPGNRALLTQDFLRMWLRSKISPGGDPPEWSEASLLKLREADPWAAVLMEGLEGALDDFGGLRLPAPLAVISAASRAMQARAMLCKTPVAGSA